MQIQLPQAQWPITAVTACSKGPLGSSEPPVNCPPCSGHGGDLGSAPMNPTIFLKNMERQAPVPRHVLSVRATCTPACTRNRDQEAPWVKNNCSQHASPSSPSARNTVKGMAPKSWCLSQSWAMPPSSLSAPPFVPSTSQICTVAEQPLVSKRCQGSSSI